MDLDELSTRALLVRILRELEEGELRDKHIENELAHIAHVVRKIERDVRPQPITPTSITFQEITMLPTAGGNTLVYTGTLAPAGSAFAPDATFTVTSNDPTVLPTVDATGLIVTVPLPTGWVESTATPLAIAYASASVSTGQALTATIAPSAPVVLATSITFAQTT